MESLPDEIILIIFGYINKVTDKRQFSKTCKRYNILTKIWLEYIKRNSKFEKTLSDLEYFSVELCEDLYFDRIPLSYLNKTNRVINHNLAKYGQLELLKLSNDNGCAIDFYTFKYAAAYGHLDILKWLKDNNYKWNSSGCAIAAENGQLEVVKLAIENGCYLGPYICSYAAIGGHLDVLKWARENGCPWDVLTRENAERNGHHELLKWAIDNGCP